MNQLKEGIIKKIKGALGLRRREARKRAGDENELLGVYGGIRLHQDSLKAKNDPDYHEATNQAATQEYRKAARYKRRFDKVAQGKNPFKEETINQLEEGKIGKWLTAPLRARKISKQSEEEQDKLSAKIKRKRKMSASEKERLDTLGNRASDPVRAGRRYLQGIKEETMNPITTGIKNIQEGNLERMRQNFNDALSRKAAEALQEKKLEVATNYFGQK